MDGATIVEADLVLSTPCIATVPEPRPGAALSTVPLKLRVRGEITVNGIAATSATIRVVVTGGLQW